MQKQIISAFLLAVFCASGQGGPTMVGGGYSFPVLLVAPGQIVRLQVTGLKTVLSSSVLKATSVPLPTSLAGISVTVNQSIQQSIMGTPVQVSYVAAILSLNQLDLCISATAPECIVTLITVQIPYEVNSSGTPPPIVRTQIVITENGVDSQAFLVSAVNDQIHVVNTCEDEPRQAGCPSIVAHVDGTVVSSQSPAKPGETVVIYAWGLGNTTPVIKTGEMSPIPAPVVRLSILVGFDFTPNAAASRKFGASSFATGYLTPGFVGLYQVNIQLPATFPAVPSCAQGGLQSNLTINLGEMFSFDGAAICVQATQ